MASNQSNPVKLGDLVTVKNCGDHDWNIKYAQRFYGVTAISDCGDYLKLDTKASGVPQYDWVMGWFDKEQVEPVAHPGKWLM